jgi:hypothetical protein
MLNTTRELLLLQDSLAVLYTLLFTYYCDGYVFSWTLLISTSAYRDELQLNQVAMSSLTLLQPVFLEHWLSLTSVQYLPREPEIMTLELDGKASPRTMSKLSAKRQDLQSYSSSTQLPRKKRPDYFAKLRTAFPPRPTCSAWSSSQNALHTTA